MRRPVGVKANLFSLRGTSLFSRRVATVAMLPSALSRSDGFARCKLGVLVSAGAAICLSPCGSTLGEWNPGQAINAVTGTRLWLLSFLFLETVLPFVLPLLFYAAAATVAWLLLCRGSYASPLTHR
jgi:hypothetical protein